MNVNRPTTSYMVTVEVPLGVSMHRFCDKLILKAQESVDGTVDQSGVTIERKTAFVRLRLATDDTAALEVARLLAGDQPFVLSTGYGVHHRRIN